MSVSPLFRILGVLILLMGWQLSLEGRVTDSLDFYVSPSGSDLASGSREAPFKTLQHAKEIAVAEMGKSTTKVVNIWLMEGTHTLSRRLDFYPEDNRQGKCKLSFKAYPGSEPVVSGGLRLTDWMRNEAGYWQTLVPGAYRPRELFVDGTRAIRARHPNTGYLRVNQVGEDRRTNFTYGSQDFPVPAQLSGVELVVFHDWSISRMPIASIDERGKRITAIDSIGVKGLPFFNLDNWEAQPRYFVENAPEFLDMDMEWVFDSQSRLLTLLLPDGQHPASLEIVVPALEGLIRFHGKRDNPVRNLSFEGLTFSHSSWELPKWGYNGVQACHYDDRSGPGKSWAVVPAAIFGEWMSNCRFEKCRFRQLGGSGLWIGSGSEQCQVLECLFEDISGNGLMIGEGRDRIALERPWYETVPEEVATGNVVNRSAIRNCGVQFYGAVGIWCGLTAETTILGNEIYDLPYTGISIGWMWNATPTPARDNIIENNHIHHILQQLSDGGGIYSLGLQPGSRLVGNHIHDVEINTGRAESNGMFLDEGTTNIVVADNLIYNIAKSPLRFHRAGQNKVENNWLFTTADTPSIMYNATPEKNILKEGNMVFEVDSDVPSEYYVPFIEQWEERKNE